MPYPIQSNLIHRNHKITYNRMTKASAVFLSYDFFNEYSKPVYNIV